MKKNIKGKIKMNMIHFRALTRRYFELVIGDRVSLIMLLLQAPLMLIVIAIACENNFLSEAYAANTTLFVITAIASVMGTLNSYREVCKEREIFLREYAAGLDATAYIMSKIAVQAAICLVHCFILTFGTLLIIDFPIAAWHTTIPAMFLIIYLTLLSSACIGIMVSCLLKSSESAILPILFIIIAQMVLSGIVIPLPSNAFMDILTLPIVTKWGSAALGHVFDIKGHFPAISEIGGIFKVYDIKLLKCFIIFAAVIVLSILISIIKIRNTIHRRKK